MRVSKIAFLALCACSPPKIASVSSALMTAPTIATVHNFTFPDGVHPRASMTVGPDGALYGTTWLGGLGGETSGGTVFRFDPETNNYSVLHAFTSLDSTGRNADGFGPVSPLAFGANGRIYGTTRQGGTGGNPLRPAPGLFFSFDPANPSDFTALHNFGTMPGFADGSIPSGGPVADGHGGWYGAANVNDVWHWTPSSFAPLHQFSPIAADRTNVGGGNPYGSPVLGTDGLLYGYASYGGAHAAGAVYAIDPVTGSARTVYDFPSYTFTGNIDNSPLQSPMLASNGAVYLASEFGGANGTGMLVKIERTATVIHEFGVYSATAVPRFSNGDGALPLGTLVEIGGWIYGTTYYGGASGTGTIFRFRGDGRGFETIYSFGPLEHDPSALCYPSAGLTLARDGALYGTTILCGSIGGGAIYRLAVTP